MRKAQESGVTAGILTLAPRLSACVDMPSAVMRVLDLGVDCRRAALLVFLFSLLAIQRETKRSGRIPFLLWTGSDDILPPTHITLR
jgi:hypothetical protein